MGKTISFEEAIVLIQGLKVRLDSWYHARLENWDYPISPVDNSIRYLIDVFTKANSDPKAPAPKMYPRPYKTGGEERILKGEGSVYDDYVFKIGTKTPEEIRKANEEFLKKNGSLASLINN